MPIFEFRCKKCDAHFEKIVSSSATEVDCPKCGSEKTEKLLSSFATGRGKSEGSSAPPPSCGPGGT